MNEFVGDLTLDLDCRKTMPKISAGQYDKGRKYLIHITANGVEFKVSDSTVVIEGIRKDKSLFCSPCSLDNEGNVILILTEEILSTGGYAYAKLVLSDSSKNYSTQVFIIDVDGSYEGDITPEENYSLVNDFMNKLMVLFELDSPSDMLRRYTYIKDITEADVDSAIENSIIYDVYVNFGTHKDYLYRLVCISDADLRTQYRFAASTVLSIEGRVQARDTLHDVWLPWQSWKSISGSGGGKGDPGEDGFSPTATVTKTGDTATITITDKDGTTTAEIADGFSPRAKAIQSPSGAIIEITDESGTSRAGILNGINGKDGENGADGFSPTATVTKTGDTATITITDKNGTTTSVITDGSNKETITNKITAITSANRSSTAQYTTPKAVADFVGQVYTPEQYGAKGDGVTDDKSAIEAMLADVPDNALCVFYGNYYISAGITITRPVNITMYGKIVVAPTADFCMRISGHDVRRNTFRLNLETTSISGQWDGTYRTIGLDLYSTWENTFDVNACNFNVGVRLISGNLDCTYNKLFIRYIFNCKTAILLTGDSTLLGGTTAQNTFVGGRIGASGDCLNHLDDSDTEDCYFPLNSELVGSRTNNNNNFVSVSFECGFAKDIEGKTNRAKINANYNYGTMIGCRFEGITSFYGSHYISLVGGYGFDNIPNKSGGYSAIGVNDVHVNGYTAPIKIARNGNSGDVIEVTNANGNKVWGLDSNGYSTNRAILLSPNGQTIIYPTSFMKLRGVSADNPTAALTALSNFEWGLSNYGFLVLKSSAGKGFVVQPIYTSAPSNPVTGTHALIDGKPMWFNGAEWVYANGDTAFSIPTKVSDLTNDAGYLTQHQDISGKVDKIEGKGLSTNDFTNAYKTKLDGIEAQANKTVVDSSLSATSTNPVQNKVIKAALDNIPQIPTDVSSFNNDAGYLTLSSLPIYNGGVQ